MRAPTSRDSATGKKHEGKPAAAQHAAPANPVWQQLAIRSSRTGGLTNPGEAAPSGVPASKPSRRIAVRLIQRKADDGSPQETPTSTPGLIVEDGGELASPGQMHKSEFLAQLRAEVCATASDALAGSIWSLAGCPWIDHWFAYYATQDPLHIERALVRYVPAAASASSAKEYIPLETERVRVAILAWSSTGELPADLPTQLPASASDGGAEPDGGLAMKAEAGRIAGPGPHAAVSNLGAGRPLDGGVRSRMEGAFGQDFSGVRVHSGDRASRATASLHARAFTTGADVAFNAGEYRPGTIEGDALLAHELAHVVQQRGATSQRTIPAAGAESVSLEDDADNSAVAAMLGLWAGASDLLSDSRRDALPSLKSGLRLQRCDGKPSASPTLKDTLRSLLKQTGTLSAGPFIAAIHAASASDRRDALNDTALRTEIQKGLGTDNAVLVMSALLEGSQKWKNPTANDFYDFFVTKKGTGMLPEAATMNCWESIMYAAYLAGDLKISWITNFYTTALATSDPNATAYTQLGFNTSLPQYPATKPKAGQIVFYKKSASSVPGHVLLSLGGDEGMSLWSQPNNKDFVQRIKLADLSSAGTAYIADPPW